MMDAWLRVTFREIYDPDLEESVLVPKPRAWPKPLQVPQTGDMLNDPINDLELLVAIFGWPRGL